jgi:putative ABC transport system ATP-binding protein
VLRARALEVRYGDRVAVRPLDLELAAGSLLAVTGPSGAGKTSLLWALAGAQPLHGGEVRIDDRAVTDRVSGAALGIAIVPQGNGLLHALTAWENVVAPLVSHGVDVITAQRRSAAALDAVGLGEAGPQLVEELSGGQQQRVAVARALAAQPRVLLADEPTSDLDAVTRTLVVSALCEAARRGTVVVLATHDPEAAEVAEAELGLDLGAARWVRRTDEETQP